MNKYQEILNHFSGSNEIYYADGGIYYIKKYDLTIRYVGYMGGGGFYAHQFQLEKNHHILEFSISAPTEDTKDIHLVDFREIFTSALNKLLNDVKFEISKYMEEELEL